MEKLIAMKANGGCGIHIETDSYDRGWKGRYVSYQDGELISFTVSGETPSEVIDRMYDRYQTLVNVRIIPAALIESKPLSELEGKF